MHMAEKVLGLKPLQPPLPHLSAVPGLVDEGGCIWREEKKQEGLIPGWVRLRQAFIQGHYMVFPLELTFQKKKPDLV